MRVGHFAILVGRGAMPAGETAIEPRKLRHRLNIPFLRATMTEILSNPETDLRWMRRALELARNGVGLCSPNPVVGCVILDSAGELAGEGWHEYDRLDHAEIVAIRNAGYRTRGGTAYVTLEPCNHTGRTGPCTEAIIAAGVQRVVAAMEDPNPINSGRGFE